MGVRSRSRKAYGVIALVAILALSFSATAAYGAVDIRDADFSGYATGTVLHTNLLETGGTRVVGLGEAVTGSQVNSNGLQSIKDEMDRVVTQSPAGKKSAGKGIALEACIGQANDEQCALELGDPAHTVAPPNSPLVTNDLVEVPGDPLVYASLLRGQSQSLWSDSQCILGRDISFGRAHAADVQLLNTGGTLPDDSFELPLLATDIGQAGVASTYSHEFMDVARDKDGKPISTVFGLSSESSMELVPITLFKGTDNEVTIQVAGTWKLRASTGGVPGSANIEYGPDETDVDLPILTITPPGDEAQKILTLDDILDGFGMPDGITIDASPLVKVVIGEAPRAIGSENDPKPITEAANGTVASAAVDVVRILVGNPDDATHVAEIRVGHMEVKAQTPAGGINCGIPVTKTSNPPGVTVGDNFVVTIKIDNPFGCDLNAVRVVDEITTSGGAKFQVIDTDPNANTVPQGSNLDSGTIVWNNIGSIPKGGTKSVKATIKAQAVGGQGGEIIDIADVSAVLGNCEGSGTNNTPITGKSLPLRVPVVLKLQLPPTGVGTSTGTILGALMLLSLAGVAIRQMRRHA